MAPKTAEGPPKKREIRKLTGKETEHEAVICATYETKIGLLKKELMDKKIIFDKLAAELFR